MDTVYPEATSLLYRRPVRKKIRGNIARYRTQPITFSEIKEVDEENLDDCAHQQEAERKKPSRSEVDLNRKFDEFRRLRDLMLNSIDNEASPDSSPVVVSPARDTLCDRYHPLQLAVSSTLKVSNANKVTVGIANPGKIKSRPSI